ncbi:nucleoside diphosphate kinase homolog 5 isoform X1 [Oncorhynchus nerka]|uniref:nucleoside diphosphate kinase homolog 5 isoform X1 n=1 Tax=Oncorhynchus nerka TaxID=8023 RepID=UPI00113165B4|nr:nucleoside diphosphate kinase homolog 5 isoform X1 [Oncorhynchus nerka]
MAPSCVGAGWATTKPDCQLQTINNVLIGPFNRFKSSYCKVFKLIPTSPIHVLILSRLFTSANVMDYETPKNQMHSPRIYVERTLALIKPDAIHQAEEIEDIILRSGFTILQKRKLQLSPEQCSDFYAEQYGKLFFPSLTAFMSSGPIIALALARDQAIAHWRTIIGPVNCTKARETHPECLRAKYGTSDLRNAVHGSDSFSSAEREIKFMFPNSVIEPIPMGEAAKDYLGRFVSPTLLSGLTELCKQKPVDPFTWLADWLVRNNPNKPQIFDGATGEEAA